MTPIKDVTIRNQSKSTFVIGGSPSTGSSLLRQLLNRHPQVFCAPETHLFAKKELYQNWKAKNRKLFNRSIFGLKSSGLFPFVGIESLEIEDYNKKTAQQIASKSQDVLEFVDQFFSTFYALDQVTVWGEKTPANVFHFGDLLSLNQKVHCIHIVRNPYDTMASLVDRGKTILEAAQFYLLNTAAGLAHIDHPDCVTIKYEALVSHPDIILQQILDVWALSFDPIMLKPSSKKAGVNTKLEGWQYDETESIGTKSIQRFQKMDSDIQNKIIQMASHLRLMDTSQYSSIEAIANRLDYEFLPGNSSLVSDCEDMILTDKKRHRFSRSNYTTTNYPFTFHG